MFDSSSNQPGKSLSGNNKDLLYIMQEGVRVGTSFIRKQLIRSALTRSAARCTQKIKAIKAPRHGLMNINTRYRRALCVRARGSAGLQVRGGRAKSAGEEIVRAWCSAKTNS